jgi:hypothetical protein
MAVCDDISANWIVLKRLRYRRLENFADGRDYTKEHRKQYVIMLAGGEQLKLKMGSA